MVRRWAAHQDWPCRSAATMLTICRRSMMKSARLRFSASGVCSAWIWSNFSSVMPGRPRARRRCNSAGAENGHNPVNLMLPAGFKRQNTAQALFGPILLGQRGRKSTLEGGARARKLIMACNQKNCLVRLLPIPRPRFRGFPLFGNSGWKGKVSADKAQMAQTG